MIAAVLAAAIVLLDLAGAIAAAEARLTAAEAEPLLRRAHLEAAAGALEPALAAGASSDARRPRALALLARIRSIRGGDATGPVAAALALAPGDAEIREIAGDLALRAGDAAGAAARYEGLETASALRNLARARLRLGNVEGARAAAVRSREIDFASEDGRSLVAWCEARARLRLARRDVAGPVTSELGPEVAARAARRIEALRAGYARVVAPRDERIAPVYVLSAATFARIAPEQPSRGFYQRDEQAVFVIGEKAPELDRLLGHECFHAHLHRALESAPAWLDEGYAEWFASAPEPHPIRLRDLAVALEAGRDVRFLELARLDRRGMYDGEGIYLRFAAAWAFVHYFEAEEPEGLRTYVQALLDGASAEEALALLLRRADPVALEARVRAHVLALAGTG